MLKAKVAPLFSGKKRELIPIALVVIAIAWLIFLYVQRHQGLDQVAISHLNNQAIDLQVKGDYKTAAEKEVEAYKNMKDGPDKATQAQNIAGVYESAKDYDNALKWYQEALSQYKKLDDKDAANNVESSIDRVKTYKQPKPQNKPSDGVVG